MTNWKDTFTARGELYHSGTVNGSTVRFFSNHYALLETAKNLTQPLASALSVLMQDSRDDHGSKATHHVDEKEGLRHDEYETEPLSLEVIKLRTAQREAAMRTLFDALADKRAKLLLGELFMDSMRDLFPYTPSRAPADIEHFLYGDPPDERDRVFAAGGTPYEGLDFQTFREVLTGWLAGNATVFGEQGKQMVELLRSRVDAVRSRLQSESETPTRPHASGSTSKTPTSEQSDTDSPLPS